MGLLFLFTVKIGPFRDLWDLWDLWDLRDFTIGFFVRDPQDLRDLREKDQFLVITEKVCLLFRKFEVL